MCWVLVNGGVILNLASDARVAGVGPVWVTRWREDVFLVSARSSDISPHSDL